LITIVEHILVLLVDFHRARCIEHGFECVACTNEDDLLVWTKDRASLAHDVIIQSYLCHQVPIVQVCTRQCDQYTKDKCHKTNKNSGCISIYYTHDKHAGGNNQSKHGDNALEEHASEKYRSKIACKLFDIVGDHFVYG
jgi:hypothetical protein